MPYFVLYPIVGTMIHCKYVTKYFYEEALLELIICRFYCDSYNFSVS